ncbi:hypothetical protein Bca101_059310 [Brassica carinata]
MVRGVLLLFFMMSISKLKHRGGVLRMCLLLDWLGWCRQEIMQEWMEKRTEHWDPLEEYRQHLFWSAGSTPLADGFSAAESRVQAGPPF